MLPYSEKTVDYCLTVFFAVVFMGDGSFLRPNTEVLSMNSAVWLTGNGKFFRMNLV